MPLSAGDKLGRYEILAQIGAGGMGEVYRARDSRLSRDVAIKVLPEQLSRDPQSLVRFEREAKAVAALSHPNILVLFDVGTQALPGAPTHSVVKLTVPALSGVLVSRDESGPRNSALKGVV